MFNIKTKLSNVCFTKSLTFILSEAKAFIWSYIYVIHVCVMLEKWPCLYSISALRNEGYYKIVYVCFCPRNCTAFSSRKYIYMKFQDRCGSQLNHRCSLY